MTTPFEKIRNFLPAKVRQRVDAALETAEFFAEMKNRRVLRAMAPSAMGGLVLQRGKRGEPTDMPARHAARFDWSYPHDQPEMHALYERAKLGQWNASTYLPWNTSVDPLDPAVRIIPEDFLDRNVARRVGIVLDEAEERRLLHDFSCWTLSQFLPGEQGALYAAAQVTESVQFFDGKLYGSTQVVDEGRHVEVFHRYLSEKLGKLYEVNDNLFVILDALLSDGRWDMKFLGMQIMVEGLALGAFRVIHQETNEPLLKALREDRSVFAREASARRDFATVDGIDPRLDEGDRPEREHHTEADADARGDDSMSGEPRARAHRLVEHRRHASAVSVSRRSLRIRTEPHSPHERAVDHATEVTHAQALAYRIARDERPHRLRGEWLERLPARLCQTQCRLQLLARRKSGAVHCAASSDARRSVAVSRSAATPPT